MHLYMGVCVYTYACVYICVCVYTLHTCSCTVEKKKRVARDEVVRWRHRLSGHESERTLGDSEGQRSLACYSPWGHKESDTI